MKNKTEEYLSFTISKEDISVFFPLFQQGVMLKIRTGCCIRSLLCGQLGMNPEYVTGRIQTVFLNGKPVDDPDQAMIGNGDTLALSAAMPGLVGATFRTRGKLAVFRSSITHQIHEKEMPDKEGMITVKFFNLLVREMGPEFLEKGIWLRREAAEDFFRENAQKFGHCLTNIRKNGKETGPGELAVITWTDDPVFIRGKIFHF
ncbi:MAG: hypothetical protein AB7S75_02175 [Desulfococcaceae bacterium]